MLDLNKMNEYRFRINWLGQLILQQQYEYHFPSDGSEYGYSETRWRDVKMESLSFLQGLNKSLTNG